MRLMRFSKQNCKTEPLDEMARCSQIENDMQGDDCGVGALPTFHDDYNDRDMNSLSPEYNALPPRYRLRNFMWDLLYRSEGPIGSYVNFCEKQLSHQWVKLLGDWIWYLGAFHYDIFVSLIKRVNCSCKQQVDCLIHVSLLAEAVWWTQ